MSEELIERGLNQKGIPFGEYEWFPTYNTTIKQYKDANIINRVDYGEYSKRKPDGLIVDRRNRKNSLVVATIEYKKPTEFQTNKQKKEAVEQCNTVCQVLNAKTGIITDGIVTLWINPVQSSSENTYFDEMGVERSYSYILNEDKQRIQSQFFISNSSSSNINKLDDLTKETYELIAKILVHISSVLAT